jgi:DNA-binding beta-propeller fold protein YncE
MALQIEYSAPADIADAIAALGRTEDVCFSPDDRRLAVVEFLADRVTVFDIEVSASASGTRIALTGGVRLSSPALRMPHGVAFVDDDTFIVTNRGSAVCLFTVPPRSSAVRCVDAEPVAQWPANEATGWNAPGSVALTHVEPYVCEVLICNNDAHTVTRNRLTWKDGSRVLGTDVLLQRYFGIPDGVTVSRDRRWIAVSNHSPHCVLLYESTPAPDGEAEPCGVLRGAYYPHGLRFSADGRHLFVADAGAPYLHVYAQGSRGWHGVSHPVATVRVMDAATFARGRGNPQEGGPKGIAIDAGSNVVVLTSEYQPLAFFDLPSVLRDTAADGAAREQSPVDVRYELSLIQDGLRTATSLHALQSEAAEAGVIRNSLSWRLTAPLRRVNRMLRRLP